MTSWRAGDRVLVRGERWTVLESIAYSGCEALRLAALGGTHVRTFVLPFDRPQRARTESNMLRVVRPRRAVHHLRRMAVHLHPAGGLITPVTSGIDLMAHQLAPALAVLRHGWARVLIADEAGLGKTIQAGIIAAELRARSASARVLIVVPAGLRTQWASELDVHFRIAATLADSAWLRRIGGDVPPGTNPWTLPDVYLTSQDFVKRPEVLRPLEDVGWDLLIVDEAHGLAIGTDRRAALDTIACRSQRVVLLTATPHDSDPPQQAALGRIGAPSPHSPWIAFRRARSTVAPSAGRRSRIVPVRPTESEHRMHRLLEEYTRRIWQEASARGDQNARLASMVLRKRALSSAGSLALSVRRRLDLLADPPAPERQMLLPLDAEEPLEDGEPTAALAAPGLADTRRELRWLSAVLETAHHAALHESKLERLVRLLRRVDEPAIVFTEYRDTLARLRDALVARGFSPALLHGGMSLAERAGAQDSFNEDARVLLATDAAAEGLNLQARCRIVIHYELPWNPARLEQRAGRVDRIGQQRRVHEVAFVAEDTAERLVLEPIARRAIQARRSHGDTRLLHTLSESRVAAAVMGDPVPLDAETVPGDVALHDFTLQHPSLLAEAQAETARLSELRRWAAASGGTEARDDNAIVSVMRSRSTGVHPVFVYQVLVRSNDGPLEHAELAAIRSAERLPPFSRSAGAVHSFAEQLRRESGRDIQAFADRIAGERLTSVASLVRTRRERQRARAREVADAHDSAARRLVQAGLFEQRRLRHLPPPDLARPTMSDSNGEAGSGSDLSAEKRLIALLFLPAQVSP